MTKSLLPMMSTIVANAGALSMRAAGSTIIRYAVSSKVIGMGDAGDSSCGRYGDVQV